MESILSVRGISKAYKDFQLKPLHLELPKGCILGFIGENGAGKSTTIKLILDLIRRDAGTVSIFGKDNLRDGVEIRENIGVVFDELNFPQTMNAKDVGTVLRRIYGQWDDALYARYLQQFKLPLSKTFKEYSRGMKMKVSIAAALSHGAKLLILDEATSGLDPIVRDEILDVFLEFIQDEERSIFVSSHITSDLQKVADYIAFIHEGELLFCEEKDVLLHKYGILKCARSALSALPAGTVTAFRTNHFGVDALVLRDRYKGGEVLEKPSIDDIMLFQVRGEKL